MLTRKLSNLKQNLRVARDRVKALPASPRYGYIGGQGDRNLGDDAMFLAAQDLIRHARIVPYSFAAHERRLAHVGLSGRPYFEQVILGGGTFINPYGLDTTRTALRHGLPMWSLGTGVGSGGFGMSHRPELHEWRALLGDFRRLGVRGPRSKAALEEMGISRAEVLGDLALSLARERPVEPAREPPRFGVNVMLPPANEKHSWNEETLLPPFVDAIRELEAAGFVPVFFGMHRHDLEPLRRLVARLGRPDATLHFPETAEDFFALLGPCSFNVCVRLHAAVLSTCAGVPPVSFGYREKCLDFMESMSLQDWHLELSTVRPADIRERILQLSREAPRLRSPIHSRARAYQAGIRAYVEALCPAEAGRAWG
ncbi:polysaccharide pyruvyl transferase family protein [Archangium sp.]|uniref:polysaccharide pyruvyl transferase family protein n=1 Tax=Archangium sp. TaxID=1872627 RepID=UPI002D564602|nr:polysaccharide pyruvyl transferase family protein [Archangium sp.]HYO59060.1 polysaccharide pyruvyl transferase family protein [Archangium sp.]